MFWSYLSYHFQQAGVLAKFPVPPTASWCLRSIHCTKYSKLVSWWNLSHHPKQPGVLVVLLVPPTASWCLVEFYRTTHSKLVSWWCLLYHSQQASVLVVVIVAPKVFLMSFIVPPSDRNNVSSLIEMGISEKFEKYENRC